MVCRWPERIRKVMHVFRGESSHRTTGAPARKLWHALHEVDKYLIGQSGWLVNYAKRRRASLRVGTSITEGTANFLVNRRMNKSQQMRWSRQAPICFFRSAARSTTACSAPGSVVCSIQSPRHAHNSRRRLDPPDLWTVPPAIRAEPRERKRREGRHGPPGGRHGAIPQGPRLS